MADSFAWGWYVVVLQFSKQGCSVGFFWNGLFLLVISSMAFWARGDFAENDLWYLLLTVVGAACLLGCLVMLMVHILSWLFLVG